MYSLIVHNSVCQITPRLPLEISLAIDDIMAFGIQGAQFTAQYKAKQWDGKKRLYSTKKQTFPTGYLNDVRLKLQELGVDYTLQDAREIPVLDKPVIPLTLPPWDHQRQVFETCGVQPRGLIQIATGGGKSVVAAGIYGMLNVPAILITQRKELMYQLRNSLQKSLGEPVGILGDGAYEEGRLTVCMIQTLAKLLGVKYASLVKEFSDRDDRSDTLIKGKQAELYRKLLLEPNLLLADECLPFRQEVSSSEGNLPIGRIYKRWAAGKYTEVWSRNLSTGAYELKPVTYAWKRPFKPCLRIRYGAIAAITLTPNHPVLTPTGFVPAGELKVGDAVIGKIPEKHGKRQVLANTLNSDQEQVLIGSFLGDGHVNHLPSGHLRLKVVHGPTQKAYSEAKARIFGAKSVSTRNLGFPPNNMCHHFVSPIFYVPGLIPTGKKTSVPQWMIDKLDHRALAIWTMDDGSIYESEGRLHTCSFDLDSNQRLVTKLKAMGIDCHVATVKKLKANYYTIFISAKGVRRLVKDCNPYVMPGMEYKLGNAATPYVWDTKYLETGVGFVTHIGRKETAEGKQRTHLYDLEVADNHNFVAVGYGGDGLCVHNCHHLAANSSYAVAQAMTNAYWRYGLSATSFGFREDGKDFFVKAAIGDVITRVTTSDLVKVGHLVPTDVIEIPYSHRGKHYPKDNYSTYYDHAVTKNDERNKLIVEMAYGLYKKGKSVLVAVQRVDHGKLLEEYLQYLVGPLNVKFIYGEDESVYRKEHLGAFADKKLPILISTLVSEGVDWPHLSTTINCRGEESRIATIQLMGRSMRKYPGKEKALYIDIMDDKSGWLARHARTRKSVYDSEPVFKRLQVDARNIKSFVEGYH